jgi:tyrosyl-tRNA synthetase
MLYPVIQGIDSGILAQIYGSCDLEVGGTDQTFNMLVGRDVMKMNNQTPQAVLSFDLLVGLDGKEKMSKSLDNYISVVDTPNDMYGKTMSIPDAAIATFFELCTYTPMDEVKEIQEQITKGGTNPRDLKMRLAREIIAIYHGEKAVKEAEENFVNTFQKKEIPTDIEEVTADTEEKLVAVLLRANVCESKSECTRLIEQGAVHNLTEEKEITEREAKAEKGTYRIGKKKFIKIV